jgi:prevent-host-death family protein
VTTKLTIKLTVHCRQSYDNPVVEGEFQVNDAWQAAAARHRFSELMDAAVDGRPQVIRRRDGREVVVVSKEYYEQTKPSLKSVLLSLRFGERGDTFEKTIETARAIVGSSLTPSNFGPETGSGDSSRHGRSK